MDFDNKDIEIDKGTEEISETGDTVSEETAEDISVPQKPEKPQKPKKGKNKHRAMSMVMTVAFIVLVIGINIVTVLLSERYPSMNIDLTNESLNTLSEEALEAASKIESETTIHIMASEDAAKGDQVYSGSIKYSQVANLAEKMREVNQKIQIHYVELDVEPDFINNYPDDSITTGCVIVESSKRHKVLTIDDLFAYTQDQTTGVTEFFSKVDGALANALTIVNLEKMPVLAIATGHSEMLTSDNISTLLGVFEGKGFSVIDFNILTAEVPEDAQVILIPTPSTDYTAEEIEKLRTFLSDDTTADSKTIIYSAFYTQGELPNIASFLEEWGVSVNSGIVQETNSSAYYNDPAAVFANSVGSILSEGSYPYLLSPATSPIELLFSSNDGVSVSALWSTNDTAQVITEEAEGIAGSGEQVLMSLSQKYSQKQGASASENVVVLGSSFAIFDSYISTDVFGNKAYFQDLVSALTGVDNNQVYIEEVATSSYDVVMSANLILIIGLGVFTIAVPLIILIIGLVIFLRRRHL